MRARNYDMATAMAVELQDFEHTTCFGRSYGKTQWPLEDFETLRALMSDYRTFVIFSYQTPVMVVWPEERAVYRTPHKYSHTTSKQVGKFSAAFKAAGFKVKDGE